MVNFRPVTDKNGKLLSSKRTAQKIQDLDGEAPLDRYKIHHFSLLEYANLHF